MKIEINTKSITPQFRKALMKIIEEHPGSTPLTVFVTDPVTRYTIEFRFKKHLVSGGKALEDALAGLGAAIII